MRKIKIIFLSFAGLVVLLIALIGMAVVILDDEDYQKIVTAAVERYTGYRVIIEGDFDLDLSIEPSLSASNIRFETSADGLQPPITHMGHIYIKLAAKQLLTGIIWIRQLVVEDVTLLLTVGGDRQTVTSGPKSKEARLETTLPIFESVSLRNIVMDLSDVDKGHLFQARLNDFKIRDDPASDLMYAKGEGIIDIYDFKIEGRSGSLTHVLDNTKPYPIELNLKCQGADFKVSGQIDDPIDGDGLDLHVAGGVAELSNFLKLFQVDFPGLGRLKFATDISGNLEALRAANIDVTISEGLQVELEAKGSMSDVVNGKGVNIAVTGSSTNNGFIQMLLPDILSDFTKLQIKGNLRDRQGDYVLEDIVAQGSNDPGLALNAEGILNFGRFVDDSVVRELDLNLQVSSLKTKDAQRFLVDILPELGPVTAKARLKGPIDRLSLEDLTITINESGPLEVKAQGRIEWIPIDDRPISGIDLALSAKAAQTQLMASAFDIPLPELGPISVNSRLFFSDEHLQFDNIDVQTSHAQGLRIELSGNVGMNFDEAQESPGDVNVDILITAPNMGAAEPLLGARIFSDLGPVRSETKLIGTTKMLSLENIAIAVGQPGSVSMEWRGRVGKVLLGHHEIISDVEVTGSMHAERTSDLSSLIGVAVPDLGPLNGSWRAVDRKGVYGFDDMEFFIGDPEGFHIKAVGTIDSVMRHGEVSIKGIDFDLTAVAPKINDVPVLAGWDLPDLGNLQVKAHLNGGEDSLEIKDITIVTGPEKKPTFFMKGEILGIENSEKTAIDATFEAYAQPWVEKLMKRSMPENHRLFGTVRVTGLTDHFR
ncbi:MAG: AsmA family protein, partial [Deltaproteobacteria bacterium]|nr:AsmA family protein [Deltaproteobacteria bacterium]